MHVSVLCFGMTVEMTWGSFCGHRANSEPDCSKRFVDKSSKVAEPYAGELVEPFLLSNATVTSNTALAHMY